jgi:hypothetical protein
MTILAPSQIAQYAYNAGFRGPDLVKAIAIALKESIGGNPTAVNPNDPGTSVGLWQINLGAHPQYIGTNYFDPQTNANDAFAVYQAAGNSFRPWSTFTTAVPSQSYTTELSTAQAAVNATPLVDTTPSNSICDAPTVIPIPGCPSNTPGGTANSQGGGIGQGNLLAPLSQLGALGDWLSNPIRIIELVGGAALIFVALLLLVVPDAPQVVAKAAKDVAVA